MLQSRAGPPLSAWELSLGSSKNRFVSENLTLRLHAWLAALATENTEPHFTPPFVFSTIQATIGKPLENQIDRDREWGWVGLCALRALCGNNKRPVEASCKSALSYDPIIATRRSLGEMTL